MFGMAGSLGKYGIGLGFLANAFFSADGEGGLTMDSIADFADNFGIDASFLQEGTIGELLDGREGPLSLLMGALTVFPDGMKKWGVYAGLAWLGASLYKDYAGGEFRNVFGASAADDSPTQTVALTPEQRKLAMAERLAEGLNRNMADPAELTLSGNGAHGMVPREEIDASLDASDRELEGRELINE